MGSQSTTCWSNFLNRPPPFACFERHQLGLVNEDVRRRLGSSNDMDTWSVLTHQAMMFLP
jgi:hypothetical protein